ncbi:MAG: ATP-binding protein [Lachnospiraceae bacterium]|nr:ATP-binding protein [Lachnospiraceae bacterium]
MIHIPEEFSKILSKNSLCDIAVKQTIENVAPILEDNKMEFFPEYTNHGERHISSVLSIASKIIESKTYASLTAMDIEVLINAILLHDISMHLSYAGFVKLIQDDNFSRKNVYNDQSWSILWDHYFKEAVKWNQEKREEIFGEYVEIKPISRDEKYANKIDKLLIGEFLRRYHHKLAFDIAVNGFPGNNVSVDFLQVSDETFRQIVGHVARSHGMGLWEMVDYMKEEYENPRVVLEVKLIYIMAILRLSDYFDIDKSRANKVIWNVKKLDSGISQMEWEKHNCIDGIDFDYQDDAESLYIRLGEPNSSSMFLKIEKFIQDLQDELDTAWAVIGKIYNRFGDFNFKFRRIYSNLGKVKECVNYITEKVTFDVNKNILFYLAQPLYGKNPSYGIRELIQNASDACKERQALETEKYIPKITMEVKEEGENKFFIISDNGIGMTKDVIINYFLVAGSSFRNDIEWKKRFLLEDENVVVRNGKFGIGVIAAFLLGNNVQVKTTSFNQEGTYSFSASLNTKQIELIYDKEHDSNIGTVIKIELNENICELLQRQWNNGWESNHFYWYQNIENVVPWHEWYKLEDIIININVPKEWKKQTNNKEQHKWNSFSTDDYENVQWTYEIFSNKYRLICNGIIIPGAFNLRGFDFPSNIIIPLVSVTDRDGKFPLNLNRNSLEENRLPFEEELMKEIYNDTLETLENSDDFGTLSSDKLVVKKGYLRHPSIGRPYYGEDIYGMRTEELIFNKAGYCLCYDYCLQRLKEKKITKIWVEESLEIVNKNLLAILGKNVVISQRDLPNSIDSYKFCLDMNMFQQLGGTYKFDSIFIIMKRKKYDYLFESGKNRMRSGLVQELEILSANKEWICLGRKGIKQNINIDKLGDLSKINLIVQYKYKRIGEAHNFSEKSLIFNKMLEKRYDNNIFIPYHKNSYIDGNTLVSKGSKQKNYEMEIKQR